jgi:uncharacterized RDD family membrane protein YckC
MSFTGLSRPFTPAVEVCSWTTRFVAWMLDGIFVSLPLTIWLMLPAMSELTEAGLIDTSEPPDQYDMYRVMFDSLLGEWLLFGLIVTVALYVYTVVMHATLGQTLGKMACGIKVVKEDGSSCGWAAAAKRGLIYPLAGGVPFLGAWVGLINQLSPLWDKRQQSFGDRFAGTYVVKKQA